MDSNNDIIEAYFREEGHKYGLDFGQFKIVCLTPFKFMKKVMNTGKMKHVRLKYFGIFYVSQARVNFYKELIEQKRIKDEKSKSESE